MTGSVLSYVLRFMLFVLLQVLVLNRVLFFDFVNPYLYVLFIITLPTMMDRIAQMLVAFLLGLCVDIFSGTIGLNAFACVLTAYIKPFQNKAFGPQEEFGIVPSFTTYGVAQFVQYSSVLVLIHHLAFFIAEAGSFEHFGTILLKTLCRSVFTMLLIISVEYFKSRK